MILKSQIESLFRIFAINLRNNFKILLLKNNVENCSC